MHCTACRKTADISRLLSDRPRHVALRYYRAPGTTSKRFVALPQPPTSPCKDSGYWSSFCCAWNEVLARRPLAMVVFFNATSTMTWLTAMTLLSSSAEIQTALAAPDYAVGWLTMRSTFKIRQPLNFALAAAASKRMPSLSLLKVSPLLTAVAADPDSRNSMMSVCAAVFRWRWLGVRGRAMLRRLLTGAGRLLRLAEGPLDKCGFAYFLSAKFTNLCTVALATVASMQYADLQSRLAAWGVSGDLQEEAGLLACASFLNVTFVPLHFYASVQLVRFLEGVAEDTWKQVHLEQHLNDSGNAVALPQDASEMNEEEFKKNLIILAACGAALTDAAVCLYFMRRLTKSPATCISDSLDSADGTPI
mmetsp:Transcript_11246/g.24376  ORF Transcript_11246/g.24376 Transcript_11246/m.24376 type:complete len:363 (-) Transcript_11246:26-1114(-)|eukprot:s7281_g3.t1